MPGLVNHALIGALVVIATCAAPSWIVFAQDAPAPTIPPAAPGPTNQPSQTDAPQAPAQPAPQKLNEAQLDQFIAPVALYPDPILSQLLMASTYPLEVVEAAHWVQQPLNKSLTGDALTQALKNQNWDPSVMALVPFPRVLAILADQVRWTEQLGNTFLAQQGDVMASVQRLRHAALAAGNLKATPQCHCTIQTSGDQISILPSEPKVVCIPVYNPSHVYGTWWEPAYPPVVFPLPTGFVFAPGFWIGFEPPIEVAVFGPLWGWGWFDWGGGRIVVDNAIFGRLDPNHAAFAGGTWVHDPAHRRGVAYNSAAIGARFGGASRTTSVAVSRGTSAVVGGRFGTSASVGGRFGASAAVRGRFGAVRSTGSFPGAGRSFAQGPGLAMRGSVGRSGPGAFHAGSFARGVAPQIARGRAAPAHFSPGGGPRGGGPGGGPHGGGGHHH